MALAGEKSGPQKMNNEDFCMIQITAGMNGFREQQANIWNYIFSSCKAPPLKSTIPLLISLNRNNFPPHSLIYFFASAS